MDDYRGSLQTFRGVVNGLAAGAVLWIAGTLVLVVGFAGSVQPATVPTDPATAAHVTTVGRETDRLLDPLCAPGVCRCEDRGAARRLAVQLATERPDLSAEARRMIATDYHARFCR